MMNRMAQVAPDVYLLSEFPRRYLNAYIIDDVLVDAGTRWWGRRLSRCLRNHDIEKHVLTHAHPDHQGMSAAICDSLHIPLICHGDERAAVESGKTSSPMPQNRTNELFERFMAGTGHAVAETVTEGDTIGGFEVIETPGNAPGHISLWREADGTVILGDVLANINLFSLQYGLHEIPSRFTHSPTESIESARKIADLEPDLICFGHGPPITDGTKFQDFVASLG
ncbi:MBL fold metallo-hydrolase [Halostella pelagica]|uniref:MBL fold metallo-hydrolase n=1 Tax=Halostella pelagica TaxID=2583824 RepID=UPI0010821110